MQLDPYLHKTSCSRHLIPHDNFYSTRHTRTLLEGFKCEFENENNERRRNWGYALWFIAL
jgi:hypothetical protein